MSGPFDLLVVSTWFPAHDDPVIGRFVADQVDALRQTGRVRPEVASFEEARIEGGAHARADQARAILRAVEGAIAAHPAAVARQGAGGGPPGVPVARLCAPAGVAPVPGEDPATDGRAAALLALARRRAGQGERGWRIVHAHTGYPDGAAAALAARRLGVPLVVTEHASFVERHLGHPERRRRYLAAVEGAARFIAVSETLARELRAAIPELAERLVVVPNAVPVAEFPLADPAARRPGELLFVGYFKESKGIETLLRAFMHVRRERADATLRLIGGAPTAELDERWRALVTELGVADSVGFEPAADRAGIARAMARASLFVHPSPRETFGVVAVEALATGLPVVAADSGGVTEILGPDPERFGGIASADDPAGLAAAVVRGLDRARARGFDGAALRASVEARFGASVVADRLLGIYDDVLATGGVAPAAKLQSAADERWIVAGRDAGRNAGRSAGRCERDSPIVIAGFAPDRFARALWALPAAVRTRIILVTIARVPFSDDLPGVVAGVVVANVPAPEPAGPASGHGSRGGLLDRVARVSRDPLGWLARRRRTRSVEDERVAAARGAIEQALSRAVGGAGGEPVDLVCLDGLAFAAAEGLGEGPWRRAPGGLRWLADQWLADGGVDTRG